MQRVLDLGCGTGNSWSHLGLDAGDWSVIGLDVRHDRVCEACKQYGERGWRYLLARGEAIPLPDDSVDGVISNVALPYMDIPRALREVHRVLAPGGWLTMTRHPARFAWSELRRSLPRPRQSLFRVFVLVNGLVLHFTGKVISLGSVAESCQTKAGLRTALRRAGFRDVRFWQDGKHFLVSAKREGAPRLVPTAARDLIESR